MCSLLLYYSFPLDCTVALTVDCSPRNNMIYLNTLLLGWRRT